MGRKRKERFLKVRLKFQLDKRLESDTFWVGDMPLCKVFLMNVANFPWIILVPKVSDKSEIFDLNQSDLEKYHRETNYLLQSMSKLYMADKMNIASLGNLVSQLHTHIIVRYKKVDAWPKPVWSYPDMIPYKTNEYQMEIDKIKKLVDDYD